MELIKFLKKVGIESKNNQLSTTPAYFLAEELLKRGYNEQELAKKMLGNNEELLEYVLNELKIGRSLLDVILNDIREKDNGN